MLPRVQRLTPETAEMFATLDQNYDQGESAVNELRFTRIATRAIDARIGLGEL